jgi:hypothetical protein
VCIMATMTYAENKMVLVLDVNNGKLEKCFGTNSVGNPSDNKQLNLTEVVNCSEIGESGNRKMKVKNNAELKDGEITDIPNYTVIRTKYNPNCITIYYGGVPYTICQ